MTQQTSASNSGGEHSSGKEADATQSSPAPSLAASRQAIILVHGMGEQIPMDTIKGFVKTVWKDGHIEANLDKTDSEAIKATIARANQVWSKPDERTGSLELRRITTRNSRTSSGFAQGVRSDFFELYWADLTAGSTWDQFVGWVRYLLFRTWKNVPKSVRLAWCALWLASLIVLGLACVSLIPKYVWASFMPVWIPQALVIGLAAALTAAIHKVAAQTFGRVVRYTRADPANIAARAAIRERGLNLLRVIHADGKYDRVILVGHSLGSMLAYDLLAYFWAEKPDVATVDENTPTFNLLCRVEQAAEHLESVAGGSDAKAISNARLEYREAQAGLWKSLAAKSLNKTQDDSRWLISDFVTFGSPLTHAEFLLASSLDDLKARQQARELPTAPPYREELEPGTLRRALSSSMLEQQFDAQPPRLMSYYLKQEPGAGKSVINSWKIHHAGPFSVVRWTNVFDPSRYIYKGDLIGGPLSTVFGPAIEDIDLSTVDRLSEGFTHTSYWSEGQSDKRKKALDEAVNLLNDFTPAKSAE